MSIIDKNGSQFQNVVLWMSYLLLKLIWEEEFSEQIVRTEQGSVAGMVREMKFSNNTGRHSRKIIIVL
jgi:hypothetical protein